MLQCLGSASCFCVYSFPFRLSVPYLLFTLPLLFRFFVSKEVLSSSYTIHPYVKCRPSKSWEFARRSSRPSRKKTGFFLHQYKRMLFLSFLEYVFSPSSFFARILPEVFSVSTSLFFFLTLHLRTRPAISFAAGSHNVIRCPYTYSDDLVAYLYLSGGPLLLQMNTNRYGDSRLTVDSGRHELGRVASLFQLLLPTPAFHGVVCVSFLSQWPSLQISHPTEKGITRKQAD